MTKTERQNVGSLGESIASTFLEGKGYRLIEKNYRKPWGEIDLVMEKDKEIVFVEVKSVSRETKIYPNDDDFRPEDNVHPHKIERLERAIATYLLDRKLDNRTWRLDVVTVKIDFEARVGKCRHLQNVF